MKKKRTKRPNTRLIQLRVNAGLTQKKLSELLGLSQSMIARIEAGDRDPSSEIKIEIAKHFDVSVEWLFYEQINDQKSLDICMATGS